MKKVLVVILILSVFSYCTGCTLGNDTPENTIYFASSGDQSFIKGTGFDKGMELALDEINQKGLLAGKYKIKVDPYDDKEDMTLGLRIAQNVVEQKKYTAMIGHWSSNVALATKNIYNDGNVLVMSPMVSNDNLTNPSKDLIFRDVSPDRDEVKAILQYAKANHLKNIAVCYRKNDYGIELSHNFNEFAKDYGVNVIDSHSSFVSQYEFEQQYDKWIALNVDAVFIGDSMPHAEDFIKQLRNRDPSIPIISVGGFSYVDMLAELGNVANGIVYVDPFYYDKEDPDVIAFIKKYKEKFGEEPKYLALHGYNTIHLLADAIEAAGSTAPKKIAAALKKEKNWQEIDTAYRFAENGDPVGKKLTLVKIANGTYEYSTSDGRSENE